MRARGFTLVELVVTLMIVTVVSGALFAFYADVVRNNATVQGINESDKGAREQVDTLVDHLRNAQQYRANADEAYAVVKSGTATSVTYYTESAGGNVTYYLSGTELRRDATAAGGSDELVLRDIQSLEFSYFTVTSDSYYSGIVPTADPHAPAGKEYSLLAQIQVDLVVAVDGQQRDLSSTVRLRNSPRKERL